MDTPQSLILTGNAQLDFEHSQILLTLDRLENKNLHQAARIITCEKLLHYISEHCKDEEALMKQYNYPDIDAHINHHLALQEEFLRNIGSFIKFGGINNNTIRTIFYNHILYVDIPMLEYIKAIQDSLT